MADDEQPSGEGFLQRWSRRKAEARTEPALETLPAAAPAEEVAEPGSLADLPSLDSLTAESDFTPFWRAGVPDDIRKAALKKLWATEPSVVNYVPLVENGWDFNSPDFSQPLAPDEVARLMKQFMDGFAAPAVANPESEEASRKDAVTTEEPSQSESAPATPELPDPQPAAVTLPKRRHGGAVPV